MGDTGKLERHPIKLVRDRIRDVPNVHGGEIQIWAVGSTTRAKMLQAKLLEEAGEYLIDGGIEELADLLEVIESLAVVVEGSDFKELREVQLSKRRERGGFRRGHVMFAYPAEAADAT
jgi:predicted house-cleaning noncanonical NTP pyrophosphatase (MazG superfamily)